MSDGIVTVSGRRERSVVDLERAALVLITVEQGKARPDNALIAVLCDLVRLARELQDQ